MQLAEMTIPFKETSQLLSVIETPWLEIKTKLQAMTTKLKEIRILWKEI